MTATAPPPWLTEAELYDLTRRVRPSYRIQVLRDLSVPFDVHPDGHPIVYRRDLEAHQQRQGRQDYALDFSGLGR